MARSMLKKKTIGCPLTFRLAAAVTLSFIAPWAVAHAAAAEPDGALTIEPDPDTQVRIQRALNPKDANDRRTQLDDLAQMRRTQPEKLVRQLLYYSMYGKDQAGQRDVKEAMALGYFARELDIQQDAIAFALWPYLGTRDPALKAEVSKTFRAVHFDVFSAIIRRHVSQGHEPPRELIGFMYERSPGEALLALSRVDALLSGTDQEKREKRRSLLWAEHTVSDVVWRHQYGFLPATKAESDAMVQIEKLSQDDLWWIRFYVAAILRQHRAFRTAQLVARLAADKDPAVQEAMSFVKGEPKKRPKSPPAEPRETPVRQPISEEPHKEPRKER